MGRLYAMVVKEMWAVLRDPKSRLVLILPPLLQLFVFSFATTLDVRNVDVGVYNRSQGAHSAELVSRLAGSPTFRRIVRLDSPADLARAINDQQVIAALVIEPDFDRRVAAGKPATVGVVLDGRRSNAAQIVASYLGRVVAGVGARTRPPDLEDREGTAVTNWFNPSLDYMWFTLPSLIAIIVSVGGIAITSQTVARERELGTFDQLLVSPLRVHEILIGKMVPPFLIGMLNGILYFILAQILFGVPFAGSVLLFLIALTVYILSLIGVGMLVSAMSMTQQQGFLGSFLVSTPLIMLSGFASPIENMPDWMQVVTYANPARYFLVMVQGVFLKAMPAEALFHQLWPLIIIAFATLGAAAWLFRARME